MTTHELIIAAAFVQGQFAGDTELAADAPGGVHRDLVPPDTQPIWIVWNVQSGGNDTLTFGKVRVLSNPLVHVEAVGPARQSVQVGVAAARVDALFTRQPNTPPVVVTGGIVQEYYREQPLMSGDLINGEKWVMIGGLYRLVIQQS